MVTKDARVDAYINKAGQFAQPILKHVRQLVHQACPEIRETIKWGSPSFEHNGLLCSVTAHRTHCSLVLWPGAQMKDTHNIMEITELSAMGNFGRIETLDDLPDDKILVAYLKEAWEINDRGSGKKPKPINKRTLEIPEGLRRALDANQAARATFDGFSYTKKKEYVEWITEAKRESTRRRRLVQAVEWMVEGKVRHWKYER